MTDDNLLPFCFPAVRRKKITAAFDDGRIGSDGGVMLLAQADRRLGIAERLAQAIPVNRGGLYGRQSVMAAPLSPASLCTARSAERTDPFVIDDDQGHTIWHILPG